jgi:carbamoylphosphate synthase large subunit
MPKRTNINSILPLVQTPLSFFGCSNSIILLAKFGMELIGASKDTIDKAEDILGWQNWEMASSVERRSR